jgi:dTDP-4-amino-4,6-dideoxygalactose transaminase
MTASELTYYRGRVGLHAVLEALGIGAGDEVITQAYTCVAVPEAILARGARPVYADVERHGLNIDPDSVCARLTASTRAIVVQHTFGIPARMGALMAIAHAHGVPVIEDCCHTLAGRYSGDALGSFGVAAFYSYEWGKPLVVGVGGSVRVNDSGLAEKLERSHARLGRPSWRRQLKLAVQYAGFGVAYHPRLYWLVRDAFHWLSRAGAVEGNYHEASSGGAHEEFGLDMAPMQRALLTFKRRSLARDTAHRRRLVSRYRRALDSLECSSFPEPAGADVVYARLPLHVEDKRGVLGAARRAGIELAEWYSSPVHPLEGDALAGVGYRPESCPVAESRCAHVVSLPTHRGVDDRFVERAAVLLRRGGLR